MIKINYEVSNGFPPDEEETEIAKLRIETFFFWCFLKKICQRPTPFLFNEPKIPTLTFNPLLSLSFFLSVPQNSLPA